MERGMKATLLYDQLTPLTADEAIEGMRGAILKLKGKEGSPEQVATLISQSALETGHWKSIHRYNVGNAKAGPNYEGFYCRFRCNEIINGKVEWFDPPHPQCNFRAFYSAADGFADHIKLLATVPRYAKAWACAERGDPEAFSRACAAAGYYTANVEQYTSSVVKLFGKYLPLVRAHFTDFPSLRVPGFTPGEETFPEWPEGEDSPPLAPPSDLRALATAASADARLDDLERMRIETMRELSGLESVAPEELLSPEDEVTKPDGSGNV